MQQRLVSALYREVNITPDQVEYIEAHGTGTKVSTHTHTHTYTCTLILNLGGMISPVSSVHALACKGFTSSVLSRSIPLVSHLLLPV